MSAKTPERNWWGWFYDELWWRKGTHWGVAAFWAIASIALTVFLIAFLPWRLADGLPAPEDLREIRGVVKTIEHNEYGATFKLQLWTPSFWYQDKGGGLAEVLEALRVGHDVTATVDRATFDPASAKRFPVFSLAVDGKMVRTFEQVSESWKADNRLAPWIVGAFVIASAALLATAVHEYRRQRDRPQA